MQTSIVHSREPLRLLASLGKLKALSATVLVFGSVLSALFWPAFAFDTLLRTFEAGRGDASAWREATDVFVYILALAGIWSMAVPAIVAAKLRRLRLTAKDLALAPVYYLLVSLAAWTAILDLAVRPHYWAKTEHGRIRRPGRIGAIAPTFPAGRRWAFLSPGWGQDGAKRRIGTFRARNADEIKYDGW